MIIGRTFEKEKLIKAYESEYSQFVTVYGRRRVGKTFFVRETFRARGIGKIVDEDAVKGLAVFVEKCKQEELYVSKDLD